MTTRGYQTTINFEAVVPRLSLERDPDQADWPVIVGNPVRLLVYFYRPVAATIWAYAAGAGIGSVLTDATRKTETAIISYEYGWGDMPRWDSAGRIRHYRDDLREEPMAVDSLNFFTKYKPYIYTPTEVGDVTLEFFYGDYSAPEAIASITLTATATGDAAAGAVAVAAEKHGAEPINPGVAHTVRVYYYHPDATLPGSWAMPGVTLTAGTTGTETITETLRHDYGVARLSKWDTDGHSEITDPTLAETRVAFASVSYDIPYRDYTVEGAAVDTTYVVEWFYEDDPVGEASAEYTFTPVAPDPVDPPPVLVDVTIVSYNYYTGAVIAGDGVYVDGSYVGATDSNGRITIADMEQGTSHTIRFASSGYQDSDADELENDTFTVP